MPLVPDLLHIALASEWEQARAAGSYERSTRDRSLAEVGFIHLSFVWQVERVAAFLYADEPHPLVLLRIDPAALTAPLKIEALEGDECFPHLYGPLPASAVIELRPLERTDGSLRLPGDWAIERTGASGES